MTLMSAQTEFEVLLDLPAPQVALYPDIFFGSDVVGASLVQYTGNPHSTSLESASVRIDTLTEENVGVVGDTTIIQALLGSSAGRAMQRRLQSSRAFRLDVTLMNLNPVDYTGNVIEPQTVNVICSQSLPHNYTVWVDCTSPSPSVLYEYSDLGINSTSSSLYRVTCPAVVKGRFNVTSPVSRVYPVCAVWDDVLNQYDTSGPLSADCTVAAYNVYNTTCSCSQGGNREFTAFTNYSTTALIVNYDFFPAVDSTSDTVIVSAALALLLASMVVGILGCIVGNKLKRKKGAKVHHGGEDTAFGRGIRPFFESVLPAELRPGPWFTKWMTELSKRHSLITCITKASVEDEGSGSLVSTSGLHQFTKLQKW